MKMEKYKREFVYILTEVVLMIVLAGIIILVSDFYGDECTQTVKSDGDGAESTHQAKKNAISVWYNDICYEQYFEVLAAEYKKETGIDVHVTFVPDMDYLDNINKANRADGSIEYEKPDVYLLSTEELEAAYGYGLAGVNDDVALNEDNFTKKSLQCVTYKGKYIAYPLAYDTAFMLYNQNYMQKAPVSFEEIIRFSNEFDYAGNENVKRVLYYNVSEAMHNYCFVGAYLNFGGICGDDKSIIDIENDSIKKAAVYYTELSKAVGIDIHDSELGSVPEKFVKEEIICTIVTIRELNEIQTLSEGKELNYSVCVIPKLGSGYKTKSLSITQSLVINYMSDKEDMAADFIRYAVLERDDLIYDNTGLMSARRIEDGNPVYTMIQNQYEASAALPKLMISADYYVLVGELLNQAWQGENIDDMLHKISEIYIERAD